MAPSLIAPKHQHLSPNSPSSSTVNLPHSSSAAAELGCVNCRCSSGKDANESTHVDDPSQNLVHAMSNLSLNPHFKSLNLDLHLLHDNITIDRIPKLPPCNISFAPLTPEAKSADSFHQSSLIPEKMPPSFVQPHPPFHVYPSRVRDIRELTKPGAYKRAFHFEIDVSDYPLPEGEQWMVGGSFGLMAPNSDDAVSHLLHLLHVPPDVADAPVLLKTNGGRWPTIWAEDMARELPTTRRELLKWSSDFMSVPPKKQLIRLLAEYAESPAEKQILLFLVSRLGQRAFCDLRANNNVTLLTLLEAFSSVKLPLDHLLSILPQLMPRWYSLSNDPAQHNGILEFAVALVEIEKAGGGIRYGIGSGFLYRLAKQWMDGKRDLILPMYRGLHRNAFVTHFTSDGPMCLIGTGVGIAPFRGFVQRRLMNASCAGKVWIFHGCRDSELDELYHGEWEHRNDDSRSDSSNSVSNQNNTEVDALEFHNDPREGPHHLVVESRSCKRVYVQDELRQKGDIVWNVLNHPNGKIYLCGGKQGLLRGVDDALRDICMKFGSMSHSEASNQLATWQNPLSLKYIKEIW
ncbi:FAD binding protein [Schizosaccharomyces cryophilus OY26]|uniref:FAD binding protein n=1 Tax=Schizosaccharomyces cryophilus (strain OY26 / ATCC MYA-4695 / CBS 11777 / NBRC 106824 / NRRL Y48691) TaxID=653667 RepID=S9VZM1_SCHCR|nr:FAD binding protein [Schizosaccharomyces cryophilus OY26]EPY51669.1 FAD binding protein [Schizosaccharomyces cryophilus OY26]